MKGEYLFIYYSYPLVILPEFFDIAWKCDHNCFISSALRTVIDFKRSTSDADSVHGCVEVLPMLN